MMKVRIGIADTDKVIELEVEDASEFRSEMERAIEEESLAWFTDTKGRTIGVPTKRLAFVEIEGEEGARAVGFAPAV